MPKIPTFTTEARPTAEVGGVRSSVQAPMPTFAGDLQKSIAKYYVAEKQEEAKIKSVEYENKSWNGLYDIIEKNANNPYPSEASSNYLRDTEQYKNNFLNTELANADNFTKKAFLQKFEANTRSGLLAVERQSRMKLDLNKKSQDEQFGSNLTTKIRLDPTFAATAPLEANDYVSRNYADQFVIEEKTKFFNDLISSTKLDMENPEQLLLKLSEDPSLYSNIPEQKEKAIIQAQKTINEGLAITNVDNILDNKLGVYASGGQLKNVDGNVIKEKDLQEGMNRKAQSGTLTPAQVIELSIGNDTAVPLYKSIINGGSANISDTGNKQLTRQGLEYYKLFKTQNGFNSLKSTYKIDSETLSSYARMDFATNVLKETFDSAFAREVEIKNKPENYKLRTVDDKKIDSTFAKIDMPGFFLGDIQNVQTTKYLLKNIANIYYKAGGDQDSALDGAKQFIEQNYRMDLFQQIVPKDNSQPEYHDAAIKTYIKKLYDEGRINKETNKLDDIIPIYYSQGGFSDVQGIILKNKTNDQAISIGASTPLGDFDEAVYDSARLTQKDIVEKVYPLQKDIRFADYVQKFDLLRNKRKRIFELAQPFVKSGFGQPVE